MRFDPYLYETLSFIQARQLSKDGTFLPTTFFVSFSLLQNTIIGSDEERKVAFFYLEGIILSFTHDTVQIIVTSPCGQKYSLYTLLLCDIVSLRHISLEMYHQAYLTHLNTCRKITPHDTSHMELLLAFQQLIVPHHLASDKLITLIYNGIPSLKYPPSSFEIVGTLLIVNLTTIIPLHHIQGFFIQSVCPIESCHIPREGECI